MTSATNPEELLKVMLSRSGELHGALLELVEGEVADLSSRGEVASLMCAISLEHALGLSVLVADGLHASAIGLMRLQFESLTRGIWLLYVASDAAIAKLAAPLTQANEQAAKNLPSLSDMVKQIRGAAGGRVPRGAYDMLEAFKEKTWPALNSFVHAGIHPLRRHAEGYPLQLILDVLRNSNGLSTMAGMTLAILTGDEHIVRPMARVQRQFADCLPDLH